MKKMLLLAGTFLAIAPLTQAQITLTAAANMPAVGSYAAYSFTDTGVNRPFPATGANVSWNYSNLLPDGFDNADYFSCVPLANCASFGNPDLLSGSVADTAFEYYKTTGNIFQNLGTKGPDVEVHFTDPWDMMRFPFTYNTRYVETFSGTLTTSQLPVPVTIDGVDSVDGAGYGTLTTPIGTYTNVLLIRTWQRLQLSIMGSGDTAFAYRYSWYDANSRTPILQMSYSLEDNGMGQLVVSQVGGTYSATPAAVKTVNESTSFQLIPNPSSGATRLQIPETFGTNATVLITDISGKMIFQEAVKNQSSITINTADWAKGIYLVRLQSATGQASFQKLSVQ